MKNLNKMIIAVIIFAMLHVPITAYAAGDPNIGGGGGGMGGGSSGYYWNETYDGVRVTVVSAYNGRPVSLSIDISNINTANVVIDFGKVCKQSYKGGARLTPKANQYSSYVPTVPMPKIINSSAYPSDINAKGHHNIAFIGRDQNGVARSIHLRNTNDEKKFRINVLNSDSHYGLSYFGEGEAVYAFEAPIDMLSFITLNPKDWKKNSYVALNGVSGNALYRALDEHKNLKVINLCLDNDKAGYSACESIKNELNKQGYADVIRLQSELKDWNEDLMKMRMQESSNENLYQTQEGGEGVCHQLQF